MIFYIVADTNQALNLTPYCRFCNQPVEIASFAPLVFLRQEMELQQRECH